MVILSISIFWAIKATGNNQRFSFFDEIINRLVHFRIVNNVLKAANPNSTLPI